MNKVQRFYHSFTKLAKDRSALISSFFLTALIMKGVEFFVVFNNHYFDERRVIVFYGLIDELLFSTCIYWILILASPAFGNKFFKKGVYCLLIFVLLFQLASGLYYIATLDPINSTLFKFSIDEMSLIVHEFVVFKWYYLLILIPPVLFYLLFNFFDKNEFSKKIYLLILIPFPIIFYLINFPAIDQFSYRQRALSENKSYHFLKSTYLYFQREEKSDITQAVRLFQQENKDRKYIGEEYPLLYLKENKDPLRPFFNLKETPPNIVFIIVESLSSSYFGMNAQEISLTPFLDSLSGHSLVFHNFLSTAERTFAVLPASLASLPHGDKGFSSMRYTMPKHYSLPQYLFQNGYSGAFFYGGHARFDHMDLFLKQQGFNFIFEKKEYNFDNVASGTPIDSIRFGMEDKDLFKNAFTTFDSLPMNDPYFHVYLTLSMHYPFLIKDQKKYMEKVNEIIKSQNLSEKEIEKYNKYIKAYATFLYTDDAIKAFFEKYKNEKNYENTIFFIFGDHMMGDLPQKNEIEKFRTPLIVYSPLLKRAKDIYAVNTHLDIAPSIISLLENKFNYRSPDTVHWLGSHFDTSQNFQNKRTLLFMLNSREAHHMLNENLFACKDQSFSFDHKFNLEEKKEDDLSQKMKAFKEVHKYSVLMNKIIPDKTQGHNLYTEQHELVINFTGKDEFIPLINYKLAEQHSTVNIELDIDFINAITDEAPILVISISNKSGDIVNNKYWEKYNLKRLMLNKEKPGNLKLRQSFSNNLEFTIEKGDEVKVYFWNEKRTGQNYTIRKNLVKLSYE